MPALTQNYIEFLFNPDGSLKDRLAPKVNYIYETDSYVLKYSVPGYHTPRQYFKFSAIPSSFPNEYIAAIFKLFSITNSFLYRHPHNKIPEVKKSIVYSYFGIPLVQHYTEDEIETAQYNMDLAISLGRQHHSLFYFDNYLEAYKVLHPELKYTKNVVKEIQKQFNKLIS